MKSEKLQTMFKEQVQAEMYSAYMYLAMSLECENKGLKGMAHWLKVQYNEEMEHAFRLIEHMNDRGVAVELMQIDAPPAPYGCVVKMFNKVYEHEQYVTSRINAMYEQAVLDKDYPAQICLQWFINEQVEEEATASDIVAQFARIGDKNPMGILFLDGKLGARA